MSGLDEYAMSGEEFGKRYGANGQAPAQGTPPIEAIDAGPFMDIIITPRRYVLSPWLREKGLVMVHAKAGIGKTWFALGCAHAIATGGMFLKWRAPEPLRVVYLDGEMAAQDMQERLRLLCNPVPEPGHLKVVSFDLYEGPVPNLASEEGQERVEPVVERADVVIVDNLACLTFDQGRGDAEAWEVVQPWLLGLRRRGKAAIVLHHSGKGGAQRGTSRRADAMDAIVKLERPADAVGADGCRFTVEFEKSRGQIGEAGQPFEAALQDGLWTVRDEDRSLLMAVADLTLDGKSVRKIADELGIPKSTANRMQKLARERGLL